MDKIRNLREIFRRMPENAEFRHLLRNFNWGMCGRGSPPSVKALAEQMGFDVVLSDLPRNIRGRLTTDPFAVNGYAIEVNRRDDVTVRRWTVLHEMMHFLLHKPDDPFAFDMHRAGGGHFYDQDQMRQERDANASVEGLVFGDGALKAAISLHGENKERLCRHFGVSEKTLEIALSKL